MSTFTLDYSRWVDDEPKPLAAGALTVAVHVAFAAVLFLNMSWQDKIQPHASVKLWESMPTTAKKPVTRSKPKPVKKKATAKPAPAVEPKPQQQPAPLRRAVQPAPTPVAAFTPTTPVATAEPTPPAPSIEVPVAPAPTPAPAAAPPRADLAAPERDRKIEPAAPQTPSLAIEQPAPSSAPAVLEQQPAPRPEVDVEELKRQRALALAELLREEESARLDDNLDQERQARIAEQRQRLEERERKLAQELEAIQVATQQRQDEEDAQAATEAAGRQLTDDYRARISAKIRQRVILPPDLRGNPEANYEVSLLPDGSVTQVRLLQSSGFATYDAAVERAILAAQPLPVPTEPRMFQANFKNLLLSFRPKE
jgi:colicin import membrane protein